VAESILALVAPFAAVEATPLGRRVAKPFAALADELAFRAPDHPSTATALRCLRVARDAALRAAEESARP
jgi:hypothetical protein